MSINLEEAIKLHWAGRFAAAESAYRSILSIEPQNSGALQYLGLLRAREGNWNAAAELLDKSLAINPNAAEAHFQRGIVHEALGRPADAAESYGAALD